MTDLVSVAAGQEDELACFQLERLRFGSAEERASFRDEMKDDVVACFNGETPWRSHARAHKDQTVGTHRLEPIVEHPHGTGRRIARMRRTVMRLQCVGMDNLS